TLAAVHRKPLIGVNHMTAHPRTVTLTEPVLPPFPHLTLRVSGGHTTLVVVYSEDKYERAAETVDEALGQTFDPLGVRSSAWNGVIEGLELL
ncbi:hypothetical protein DACRYDRAFT_108919, partial [Dacryopinax primogenitus]